MVARQEKHFFEQHNSRIGSGNVKIFIRRLNSVMNYSSGDVAGDILKEAHNGEKVSYPTSQPTVRGNSAGRHCYRCLTFLNNP